MALTLALATYPKLMTYVSPLAVASLGVVLFAEGFFMVVLCRTKVKRADV
jgi:hypothetical protein